MEIQHLKCVTIVAESVLKKRLVAVIDGSGATGHTITSAEGGSVHGENIKIEVVCPVDVASLLVREIAERHLERFACMVWMQDVTVIGGGKFQNAPTAADLRLSIVI